MPFNTGQPLTVQKNANDPQFDFTIKSLRKSTFKFLKEDLAGFQIGEIKPLRNTVPTLSHDTSRSVKRTMNITLDVDTTAEFDEIRDRIRLFMVLEDGREFPLGRYMTAGISRMPTTAGTLSSVALVDEMFVVAQPIPASFGAAVTQNVFTTDGLGRGSVYLAIQHFLDRYLLFNPEGEWGAPIPDNPNGVLRPRGREVNIEFTDFTTAATWQSGAAGTSVLQDLAVAGDYFSPWMGNDGTLRMIRVFDPSTVPATFDFDAEDNVYRDSITRSNDLLNAPNRIIVTSNSGAGDSVNAPVVGTYDVPNSAPHSIASRGFVIADVINMQLATRAQANAVARNIGVTKRIVEKAELTTPPDPRH